MPIPVKCECGRSMKVKDELAGKRGKCPSCGTMLLIPVLDVQPVIEEEPPAYHMVGSPEDEARPRREARRPREEDEEDRAPPRRQPKEAKKRDAEEEAGANVAYARKGCSCKTLRRSNRLIYY